MGVPLLTGYYMFVLYCLLFGFAIGWYIASVTN